MTAASDYYDMFLLWCFGPNSLILFKVSKSENTMGIATIVHVYLWDSRILTEKECDRVYMNKAKDLAVNYWSQDVGLKGFVS